MTQSRGAIADRHSAIAQNCRCFTDRRGRKLGSVIGGGYAPAMVGFWPSIQKIKHQPATGLREQGSVSRFAQTWACLVAQPHVDGCVAQRPLGLNAAARAHSSVALRAGGLQRANPIGAVFWLKNRFSKRTQRLWNFSSNYAMVQHRRADKKPLKFARRLRITVAIPITRIPAATVAIARSVAACNTQAIAGTWRQPNA
jgi:hypothetical protein